MIAEADLCACREAIRHGSRSFHAASKLLPARVRDPALALYAFCRLADDAVDLNDDKTTAVFRLRDRLDLAYAGRPRNTPADRAFAALIVQTEMPRALPEALLEGLAWDAMERRYETLSALRSYSARVASAVGAMMCVLMDVRSRDALARACDLGVAMQLTNIARDVGEDALAGRLYLPLDWMEERGVDPAAFLQNPEATPAIRAMTRALLSEAKRLYRRADTGVAALPLSCRPGIFAASAIYAGIGDDLARASYDSVTRRAHTTTAQKLVMLFGAGLRTLAATAMPRSAIIHAAPLAETRFLVDAAAEDAEAPIWGSGRSGALLAVFAQLEARKRLGKSLPDHGGVGQAG